jgi:hypothetical protein
MVRQYRVTTLGVSLCARLNQISRIESGLKETTLLFVIPAFAGIQEKNRSNPGVLVF